MTITITLIITTGRTAIAGRSRAEPWAGVPSSISM
jgi:hypothetical protein